MTRVFRVEVITSESVWVENRIRCAGALKKPPLNAAITGYFTARRVVSPAVLVGLLPALSQCRGYMAVSAVISMPISAQKVIICAGYHRPKSQALIALAGLVWHGFSQRLKRVPKRLPFCLKMCRIARLQIRSWQSVAHQCGQPGARPPKQITRQVKRIDDIRPEAGMVCAQVR